MARSPAEALDAHFRAALASLPDLKIRTRRT